MTETLKYDLDLEDQLTKWKWLSHLRYVLMVIDAKVVDACTIVVVAVGGVDLGGVVVVVVDDSLSIILCHNLGLVPILSNSSIGSSDSHLSTFPSTKKTDYHSKYDNRNDGLGNSEFNLLLLFGGS